MNKRTFALSVLLSLVPVLAAAGSVTFDKGDFLSARRTTRDGKVLVSLKLSKSGKAKVRLLQKDETIHAELGGVPKDFRLRERIVGSRLEAGPYSPDEAERVVAAFPARK
jgi:hypothetical protein